MSTSPSETYRTEWEAWRAGWEQWLSRSHGWLSAVSVNWLDSTPRRFDGTPGLWWQNGDKVMIDPGGTTMSFDGTEFTTVQAFALADGPDDQRVTAGDIEIGITYREGYHVITYDPSAPARQAFDGVPTFDLNPDWVITGKFEAFDSARSLALDTVGWRSHDYLTPGVVRFEYEGQSYEMQVIAPTGTTPPSSPTPPAVTPPTRQAVRSTYLPRPRTAPSRSTSTGPSICPAPSATTSRSAPCRRPATGTRSESRPARRPRPSKE